MKGLAIIFGIFLILFSLFKIMPLINNRFEPYAGEVTRKLFRIYSPSAYFKRILLIFFGLDWGLIFTSPFVLLGLVYLFKLKNPLKKKLIMLTLPLLVNFYIVVMWGTQGAWYGYRFIHFSIVPLLMLPFAQFIKTALNKYGSRKVLVFLSALSIFPLLSMLAFEGNTTNLALTIIVQSFGIEGWGNLAYQLEVWKTLLFHPIEFLIAVLKGGPVYVIYLFTYVFNLQKLLPSIVLTKYPKIRLFVLFKTCVIYFFPFIMYWIYKLLSTRGAKKISLTNDYQMTNK